MLNKMQDRRRGTQITHTRALIEALFILGLLGFALVSSVSGADAAVRAQPFHVVIDPGHGGADHGTIFDDGSLRITEKEATLLLSRSIAEQLRARGMQVTLTRNGDKDIPLGDRTALANRIGADVFLSIHMNSSSEQGSDPEGVETFILNSTSDMTSHRLAKLENTVLGPETRRDSPEDLDVALILRDLRLDANLGESKRLACGIQTAIVSASEPGQPNQKALARAPKDRGVKQALFHVLLGAEMPSVLLEAGFLSHPRDRARILKLEPRRLAATAVAQAIDRFRKLKNTQQALASLSRCKVH